MAAPQQTPLRLTFSIHGDPTDGPRYKEFIENLRNVVSDPERKKHGFLVLHDEMENPSLPEDFLDICLEIENKSISLLMRKDNLYIVGYKPNKPKDEPNVFELRDREGKYRRMIPNSKPLKICDNYGAFDKPLHLLSFDIHSLSRAVEVLSKSTAGNFGKEVKISIMTLIVAISEAMRFELIVTFVSNQIVSHNPKTLGSENLDELILSWANKSRAILDNDYPLNAEMLGVLKEEIRLVKAFDNKEKGRYDLVPSDNQQKRRK
ncbi:rRNA N-glycosidase [Rhynchospora pubera]|uniref:rRNA N-glycosylase n=1 Tax=Rhynchospora pubera TaxID=906938 RepID=A0AAV8GS44_9POAL|nr:rRNA N-glycosidase [Rhynchospora pubera]KAJ4780146.1 rRNA N-glycosidase [Rhynchospora pubera]KAJ4807160.1 rRNA N-glycosidase [Rhynchospora pubera]